MRVVMRLVKKIVLIPDTSAFTGQLEVDVQWEDVHAPSIMWRELLKGIEVNFIRALINICIFLFCMNISLFNVYMWEGLRTSVGSR
jgi:hypothetical protein